MSKGRCCGCNGPMAVCKNCRCVQNGTACVSCYPSKKNNCSNARRPDAEACKGTPHVGVGHSENDRRFNSQNTIATDSPGSLETTNSDENNLLNDVLMLTRAPILSRVPKGARSEAAKTLSFLIDTACNSDTPSDWQKLFRFPYFCLRKSKRGGNVNHP